MTIPMYGFAEQHFRESTYILGCLQWAMLFESTLAVKTPLYCERGDQNRMIEGSVRCRTDIFIKLIRTVSI